VAHNDLIVNEFRHFNENTLDEIKKSCYDTNGMEKAL
jgi:GTPase SAR1 family protein